MFKPKEIVVAAPALLKRLPIKTFADLKAHTLLHDDSHQTWTRWLEAVGAKGVNPRRGIVCGDRNSLLAATIEGQGVGITSELFAASELQSGRLVKVFDVEVNATFGIYAVCLPRRLNDPLIAGTMDWLIREAQSSPDASPPAP
jgi:LysR family glycine cleavage system transcriptional activator